MSPEKGPSKPDDFSLKGEIRREASHKVRTGPFGNLIDRLVVNSKQKEATQKRDIAKGEENIWLSKQMEISQKQRDPSYRLTEADRIVLSEIRKIRQEEAEVWEYSSPSQVLREILNLQDENGNSLLALYIGGELSLCTREDGNNLRTLFGLIDALKRMRFQETTSQDAREAVREIELKMAAELGVPVNLDNI